eukprot:CAMPEP_0206570084 /NCGR_PEP_ID=MMETSP0325_2-20121206/26821_1 /ASSEMBLY_ACC=CAM_ASM_000347 /TAXON_ID=2866 /ORGANISM="Crypthecodinium cohnii, Strain Seligo" /LENGTH=54 /DNA_ID=CAMNT_0054073793 /DNA_START=213 /DNA_END=374 /DNA_ORIENTATION=-
METKTRQFLSELLPGFAPPYGCPRHAATLNRLNLGCHRLRMLGQGLDSLPRGSP